MMLIELPLWTIIHFNHRVVWSPYYYGIAMGIVLPCYIFLSKGHGVNHYRFVGLVVDYLSGDWKILGLFCIIPLCILRISSNLRTSKMVSISWISALSTFTWGYLLYLYPFLGLFLSYHSVHLPFLVGFTVGLVSFGIVLDEAHFGTFECPLALSFVEGAIALYSSTL